MKRHADLMSVALFVADAVCVLAAGGLAAYMSMPLDGSESFSGHFLRYGGVLVVFLVVWCVAASEQRLFTSRRADPLNAILGALLKALFFSLIFSGFIMLFLPRYETKRIFLLYFAGGTLSFVLLFRIAVVMFLWAIRRRGYNYRQVLLIGANPRTEPLVEILTGGTHYGYQIMGVIDDDPERASLLAKYGVPYLGDFEQLERVLIHHVVDEVYISLPVSSHYQTIVRMAHLCEGVGIPVRVRLLADLFPVHIASSRFSLLEGVPILSISPIPEAYLSLMLKRAIDITVSVAGLLILLPTVFLPLSILIKLESSGPVFFRQKRVGVNGRTFKMLKFRSMVSNAEALRNQLQAQNEIDGPVFKIRHDPRVTRLGRIMRRYSIDEFPQLLNVLIGQMSLVGPRPPIPAEVDEYTWDQRRRLSVKPGMTGLWQVSGRNELSFDEWIGLDLEYIDNWSLWLDFKILLKTFSAVVRGRGAS